MNKQTSDVLWPSFPTNTSVEQSGTQKPLKTMLAVLSASKPPMNVNDLVRVVHSDDLPGCVHATCVDIIANFLVMKTKDVRSDHESMLKRLSVAMKFSSKQESWSPSLVGSLVAVRVQNVWHRAVLLDLWSTSVATVFTLDLGTVEYVPSENLHRLDGKRFAWIAELPPTCFFAAAQNVLCVADPHCIPLEPHSSTFGRFLSPALRGESVKITINSVYEDQVLGPVYVFSTLRMDRSDLDWSTLFEKCIPRSLKSIFVEGDSAWLFESCYGLISERQQIRVCHPLKWWRESLPREGQENLQRDWQEIQVMVQFTSNISAVRTRLETFINTLVKEPHEPVTSVRAGNIYLINDGLLWLRARAVAPINSQNCWETQLMDFPRSRVRTVSLSDMRPYFVPSKLAAKCPPFLCRAIPLRIPLDVNAEMFVERLPEKDFFVVRHGAAFQLV